MQHLVIHCFSYITPTQGGTRQLAQLFSNLNGIIDRQTLWYIEAGWAKYKEMLWDLYDETASMVYKA